MHRAGEPVATRNVTGGIADLVLDHVEMGIERRRDLVDLRVGEAHLVREGGQVSGRDLPIVVLDPVQVFDQEVALARLGPEEAPSPPRARRVDRASSGSRSCPCGLDLVLL